MSALTALAVASLLAWLWLAAFRGGFWRCSRQLPADPPAPAAWPEVVAVIPARDEAETIGRAVASLRDQDYPGRLSVVVVDDESRDGTAAAARTADPEVEVVAGAPLPSGWVGKVWAQAQGLERVERAHPDTEWVLLTDADIAHDPTAVRRLVATGEASGLDLVSLMVRLRCASGWERLLIPAFVFFFQKLYPFPWVADPRRRTAAAAGGCMLVRRSALAAAGGLAVIADRLIDDCALAAALKPRARIWLGLATRSRSLRPYPRLADIWSMVARSAYTQLRHSPLLLAGTLAGMVLIYLVPPLAALTWPLHGNTAAAGLGAAAWLLMAAAFLPTLRLYRLAAWRAATLPVAALLYTAMTFDSALAHWRGRGAAWKGRTRPRRTAAPGSGG